MFKYKKFKKIYFQSLAMSIPQIVTGYLCIQYLDFPLIDQPWFYIGLATSNILSPLLINVTRYKMMLLNQIMIAIGMVGLMIEDFSSKNIYRILTCVIGLVVGCDWLMTIRFIREQVGWEEDRAIHININPMIFFFSGSLIRINFGRTNDVQTNQIAISCLAILTNTIRLTTFLIYYDKQSLEYYYRQFRELQGRVIIKTQFDDDIKDVEYYYISNNEALSSLHLNTNSLFTKQYRSRFICCCILQLLSWIQLNDLIHLPPQIYEKPLIYFLAGFGSIALISQIVYRIFHVRNVLIILNLVMLAQSSFILCGKTKHLVHGHEILVYFSVLLVFITYFIGLTFIITQQLPYKGINYSINLTFISLCLASIIEEVLDQNHEQNKEIEDSYLKYSCLASNILAFPTLLKLKNTRNLKEFEIQQLYT